MSLSSTLEQIKKARPFAEENVESGPRETLTVRRGRKARAIEALKDLKYQYTNELRASAAFILVIGDKREEFTSLVTENSKFFSADPESFYYDLAKRVPTSLYLGKEGMSNVFDVIGRHLEEKMLDLGVGEYNQLIFRQEYRNHIGTSQDFVALLKKAINEQVGGEVVGFQSAKNLTDAAIERNHAAKVTPILLPTGDETFALTVAEDLEKISKQIIIVVAGEASTQISNEQALVIKEVTGANVKKLLKTISDKLKNN